MYEEFEISRETLAEILDGAGLDGEEVIREGYSGRGMYGKTAGLCLSLDGERDLRQFLVSAGRVQEWLDSAFDADWLADNAETDSMGHGIVVYWRNARIEG